MNVLKCEEGTTRNVVPGDQADVPLHQHATTTSKKSAVMRLGWILMGVISFAIVCVAIAFAVGNSQYEEPMSAIMKDSGTTGK